uniref:Uncharacterized protein n=1 Tax=Timema poppense TaxID=170557 RepID=A0A7R9CWU5_TIMPO|nr:unnamed protein product [Timema poppensis]
MLGSTDGKGGGGYRRECFPEEPLGNQCLWVEASTGDTEVLFHLVRPTAKTSAKQPCCHACGKAREIMVIISDCILSIIPFTPDTLKTQRGTT